MNIKRNKNKMFDTSLHLLKQIEDHGFSAYIVGGFVRDLELKIPSTDVDITTNATPKDIRDIFQENCLSHSEYGSSRVVFQGISFEITTFRSEGNYQNYRRPENYSYIDSLEEDLKRRDFRMNTLCMTSKGEVIDLLGARKDIQNRMIYTVGDSYQKFSQDVLRILRAIRFATVLNFRLSEDVKEAILLNKYLLKNLSYDRKKSELDKIFTSKNVTYGVKLLLELGLDEALEIPNLKNIQHFGDILGTWALLDNQKYPFTKNEKEMIRKIQEALTMDIRDPFTLYHYGPYVMMVVADIKKIPKKEITKLYNRLPIKSIHDIALDGHDIMKLLNIQEGPLIKNILNNLEYKILYSELKNNKQDLQKYVVKHFQA